MPASIDIAAALSRRHLLAGGLVLTAGCAADEAAPTPPTVRAGRVFPIPYGTSSPGTAFTLLDAFDRLLGRLA